MITLITGGPGTGKTAWLLNQLIDLKKQEPYRLLFVHGVRNLRGIHHETIYCRSQLCDICRSQDQAIEQRSNTDNPPKFVEDWPKWKQPESLIIVDEVQRIWRPTHGSQGPSEAISALETHRHYGVDFWLISQGPHLFHNFIRLLVGRHIHLVANWAGRREYEWPECKQDVQSRGDAVQRPYTLPKRVYSMYDSAEVHTKQNKRKPMSLYIALAAIAALLYIVPSIYFRFTSRVAPSEPKAVAGVGEGGLPTSPMPDAIPSGSPKKPAFTAETLTKAMTPLVTGVPWSAPIYAELAKPVSFPVVVGCIESKKPDDYRCACYSQQATIVEMPPDVCSIYVKHHAFNHFRPDTQRVAGTFNQPPASAAAPQTDVITVASNPTTFPDDD